MPIRPDQRHHYGREWRREIRPEILARAGDRCEGSARYPDCRAENGKPHPVTRSKVVLTVAHLDQDPTNNGRPGDRPNLKALCQRCHLAHDERQHATNAARTRRGKLPQLDLIDWLDRN